MKLKTILFEISLTFRDEMAGSTGDQNNMSLKAYFESDVVGRLDYVEYQKSPSVQMLDVPKEYQRKGIGSKLMKQLQKLYPNIEIDLGMLSDDGAKLIKSMNRTFTPNKMYSKVSEKLKHLKSEKDRIMKDVENDNRYEIDKLNDLHDSIDDLESKLEDMSKGKWIIR